MDFRIHHPHDSGLSQEGDSVPRRHHLFGNPRAFRAAVDALVQPYAGVRIDKVAGIEARGFILAEPWRINSPPASCRCARKASCPST